VLSPKIVRPVHVMHAALALGAGAWLAPSSARAAVALAGDLEFDAPSHSDVDTALAFGVRLGWQLHLPLIVFTPEVGYHHAAFGDDITLNRGFVGVRLGIGEAFRIGAFGHIGVGHAAFHFTDDQDITDASYDVGGFLDFTLLPLLDLGVHAGYGRLKAGEGGEPVEWVPVGAHVTLVF